MTALLEKFGRSFPRGSVIFFEHEEGEELFIIHSGEVRIIKISSGLEKTLAILSSGDIFGEMSLLEGKPRTATAIAQTDVEAMAFNRSNFEILLRSEPAFAFRLAEILGKRIVEAHRHLDNLSLNPPRARLADVLMWKVKKNAEKNIVPMNPREIAEFAGLKENDFTTQLNDLIKSRKIVPYQNHIEIQDCAAIERIIKSTKK